jgi:hypothetical protein
MKQNKPWLAGIFILASLISSACSGGVGAKPTEKEIIIDP